MFFFLFLNIINIKFTNCFNSLYVFFINFIISFKIYIQSKILKVYSKIMNKTCEIVYVLFTTTYFNRYGKKKII